MRRWRLADGARERYTLSRLIAGADAKVRNAFQATLREEPSSRNVVETQKVDADVVEVTGLARAIAHAEEIIRTRSSRCVAALAGPDSSTSFDLFDALVATDDTAGPAVHAPYVPTPVPPAPDAPLPLQALLLPAPDLPAPDAPLPTRALVLDEAALRPADGSTLDLVVRSPNAAAARAKALAALAGGMVATAALVAGLALAAGQLGRSPEASDRPTRGAGPAAAAPARADAPAPRGR